jgi:hypothetical protein
MIKDHDLLMNTSKILAGKIAEAVQEIGGNSVDLLYMAMLTHLMVIGISAKTTEAACVAVASTREFMERAEAATYWYEGNSASALH